MGMFDHITEVPEQKCRRCGAVLERWQSKDGGCHLAKIPYWHVNHFYTYCDAKVNGFRCGEWHEFMRNPPAEPIPIEGYTLLPGDGSRV